MKRLMRVALIMLLLTGAGLVSQASPAAADGGDYAGGHVSVGLTTVNYGGWFCTDLWHPNLNVEVWLYRSDVLTSGYVDYRSAPTKSGFCNDVDDTYYCGGVCTGSYLAEVHGWTDSGVHHRWYITSWDSLP